jgi:hypothetical protein
VAALHQPRADVGAHLANAGYADMHRGLPDSDFGRLEIDDKRSRRSTKVREAANGHGGLRAANAEQG